MPLKNLDNGQLETLAYFIVGILSLLALVGLAVFDLTQEENISPIVYGGLIGAILRVAVKGFNVTEYFGGTKEKK